MQISAARGAPLGISWSATALLCPTCAWECLCGVLRCSGVQLLVCQQAGEQLGRFPVADPSQSADVRRNGGPGWQRRISSRVPRWVPADQTRIKKRKNKVFLGGKLDARLKRCLNPRLHYKRHFCRTVSLVLPLFARWPWSCRGTLASRRVRSRERD